MKRRVKNIIMETTKKYLYRYDTLKEITDENNKSFDWKIANDSIENRSKKIETYKFFVKMKKDAKLFSDMVDDKEIISWLDSLTILIKLLKSEKLSEKIKNAIIIFQEYIIPYSNNYRADYLLCVGNKIMILEFSYKNESKNYDKKLIQALRYKEVLETIIPRDYIVGQFIFTYYPEYEKDLTVEIKENINKNQKILDTLVKLVNKFFNLDSSSNMLELLE